MLPLGENEGQVFIYGCLPVAHRCHVRCGNGQPEQVKPVCRVCGQPQQHMFYGNSDIAELLDVSVEGDWFVDATELPPLGRQMFERFVTVSRPSANGLSGTFPTALGKPSDTWRPP